MTNDFISGFDFKKISYPEMCKAFYEQASGVSSKLNVSPYHSSEHDFTSEAKIWHETGVAQRERMQGILTEYGFYKAGVFPLMGDEFKADRDPMEQIALLDAGTVMDVWAHPFGFIAKFVSSPGYISKHFVDDIYYNNLHTRVQKNDLKAAGIEPEQKVLLTKDLALTFVLDHSATPLPLHFAIASYGGDVWRTKNFAMLQVFSPKVEIDKLLNAFAPLAVRPWPKEVRADNYRIYEQMFGCFGDETPLSLEMDDREFDKFCRAGNLNDPEGRSFASGNLIPQILQTRERREQLYPWVRQMMGLEKCGPLPAQNPYTIFEDRKNWTGGEIEP